MCPLYFLVISSVLGLLYHHCYSCQKTRSRLHTPISTVVHAKVVCAPKMLPIGIFLSHILRSKIIALWDMSQYQNSPRISLETSVFYLNFRVRFFLVMLWTSKLDKAAEETWVYFSTVPLAVERKLTSYPSFFRDPVQFACSKHNQKEANLEIQVENARFQRNARGVLVLRHVPECNDLRS